jgi:hypothetical protein
VRQVCWYYSQNGTGAASINAFFGAKFLRLCGLSVTKHFNPESTFDVPLDAENHRSTSVFDRLAHAAGRVYQ